MKQDTDAMDLCGEYREEGVVAFVIRSMPDGNVRYIGPHLPPKLVSKMLRAAADGYEAAVTLRTVN
jgi:hypothetical protein